MKLKLLAVLVAALAIAFVPWSAPSAQADTLHGFCSGCSDNGTNTPTTLNPPAFGFSGSAGVTGDLFIDVLVPDNLSSASSFGITGDLTGTATLFSTTAWTSGKLDTYLGISASPQNPIGAYLPTTQTTDPGATGFFVYQAELGTATLGHPGNGPNLALDTSIPVGSYLVAFVDTNGNWSATANSAAILETGGPGVPTPEPSSLLLLLPAVLGLGLLRRRNILSGVAA